MNHNFAYSSKDPFVPKSERFLVSLSNGRTIFQDLTPGISSCWVRLGAMIASSDLHITNVRLEAFGQRVISVPFRNPENGENQISGYWHSNKMGVVSGQHGSRQIRFIGIGFVRDEQIFITWIREDGANLTEVRPLRKTDGSLEPGVILQ